MNSSSSKAARDVLPQRLPLTVSDGGLVSTQGVRQGFIGRISGQYMLGQARHDLCCTAAMG
ncbi:MAG: hypothetical protein Q8R82_15470 [Hyphomonadaceae bacterium]|nr:hypothetical protein [Hyphomonadaceae bacterium]